MYLVECFDADYMPFQTPIAFARLDDAKIYAYDCSHRYLDLDEKVVVFDKNDDPIGYYTYNGIWEDC